MKMTLQLCVEVHYMGHTEMRSPGTLIYRFPLDTEVTVGREPSNMIVLPSKDFVSREHLKLSVGQRKARGEAERIVMGVDMLASLAAPSLEEKLELNGLVVRDTSTNGTFHRYIGERDQNGYVLSFKEDIVKGMSKLIKVGDWIVIANPKPRENGQYESYIITPSFVNVQTASNQTININP